MIQEKATLLKRADLPLVAACYLFIFFFLNYQNSSFLTAFAGEGDSLLYIWLTWQKLRLVAPEGGFEGGFFDLPFFYPEQNTLAYSDNYLFPSLVSLLVYKVTGNFALSYNLPLLLAGVLRGVCTYLLAKRVIGERGPAFLSGLLFMLAPWFVAQTQHPQLQYAFVFPLGMSLLLEYLERQRISAAVGLGFTAVLAFLSSVYYFYFLLLLAAIVTGLYYLSFRHSRGWSSYRPGRFIVVNLPAALSLLGLAYPYHLVASAQGTRNLSDIGSGIDLAAFISFPTSNLLWGELTAPLTKSFETHFGLGVLWSVLLISALVLPLTDSVRKVRWLLFAVLALFVLLAFGPLDFSNGVGEREVFKLQPYYLLYKFLPGFSAIRAAGRFAVIALLCSSLLAGIGARGLIDLVGSWNGRFSRSLIYCAACALAVFELRCEPLPTFNIAPAIKTSDFTVLAVDPGGASAVPVLALPYPRFVRNEAEFSYKQLQYMIRLRELPVWLVNGYSGVVPKFQKLLHHKVRKFPNPGSAKWIASQAGLRYVFYFSQLDEDFNREEFEAAVAELAPEIKLQQQIDGVYLFSVE